MTTNASSLWMGDLESYMNEMFISSAFAALGESVVNVKLMKHKTMGTNLGYCFVEFETSDAAENALKRLNGLPVPGTNPIKRFKLNHAVYGKDLSLGQEFSLYVGDLSPIVTDQTLLVFFQAHYKSVKAAKVVCDATGKSKRFGFIRFYEEEEYRRALNEMQGAIGPGGKPIKVNAAIQKGQSKTANDMASANQYYQQYQQQYQQYLQSYYQQNSAYQHQHQPMSLEQYYQHYGQQHQASAASDQEPEDPNPRIDIEELNRDIIENSKMLYFELEESRWNPIESYASTVPTPKILT